MLEGIEGASLLRFHEQFCDLYLRILPSYFVLLLGSVYAYLCLLLPMPLGQDRMEYCRDVGL
jgi:hypothetical protein